MSVQEVWLWEGEEDTFEWLLSKGKRVEMRTNACVHTEEDTWPIAAYRG